MSDVRIIFADLVVIALMSAALLLLMPRTREVVIAMARSVGPRRW